MTKRWASLCAGAMLTLVLAGVLLSSGGCQAFAFVTMALFPPRVDAMYEPPKTPMLVMVENRANPGMLVAETDQLTGFIMDELITYEVAPLVPRNKLEQLRDTRPDIDKMSISQIGKAAGAEQVLYVDLQRLQVGGIDGIPAHGRVSGRVHIVDVKTGVTKFPKVGAAGWPVSLETPITQDVKESDLPLVRERMLRALGTSIGRMFHDYNPEG